MAALATKVDRVSRAQSKAFCRRALHDCQGWNGTLERECERGPRRISIHGGWDMAGEVAISLWWYVVSVRDPHRRFETQGENIQRPEWSQYQISRLQMDYASITARKGGFEAHLQNPERRAAERCAEVAARLEASGLNSIRTVGSDPARAFIV